MGFANEQPSYTITFRDASGTAGWLKGYLSAGGSASGYLAAVDSLAARMQAISSATLVRYTVNLPVRNTEAIIPASRNPIDKLSRWIFSTDLGTDTFWSILLPYKDEWLLTSGPLAGVYLDLTNSDVVSLSSEFISAPFLDQFGGNLIELVAAYIETSV